MSAPKHAGMPAEAGRTLDKYMKLPLAATICQAEYIWIDAFNNMRGKTMTLSFVPERVEQLRIWNFDGSSTGQAPGHDSEVLLKPAAMFPDPFRGLPHVLVLCECMTPAGEPMPGNTRSQAKAIFDRDLAAEPWYGLEQEYTLFKADGRTPLGFPDGGFPAEQGPYYCSVGGANAFGRAVAEAHYRACLYAGLKISGINGEVMPGQWEFQVGPCTGIESGDHLWTARYIMERVCEDFGVVCSFSPKPMLGDWNGAGCHANFSTKAMREEGGYKAILAGIEKLGTKVAEHIAVYGAGNDQRLTGQHETAPIDKFSYGVASRAASVRIPRETEANGCGYFEDRRPAGNCDPYLVSGKLFETCHLE